MKRIAHCLLLAVLLFCALALVGCDGDSKKDTGTGTEKTTATITFDTGTEEVISPITSKIGGKIYPPADPEREGYRFDGWLLNGEPFVFDVMPASDLTLHAAWTKYFTLRFETGEGATVIPEKTYTAGETIELPAAPARTHYIFLGWTLDGAPFTAGVMPPQDITLKAEWEEAVTISFVTGTSDCIVPSIVARAGETVEAPKVNRRGFHLNGWKTAGGDPFVFDKMPESDLTLYADWMELTNLPTMFIDLFDESGNTFPLSSVDKDPYVASRISLENTEDDYLLDSVQAEFKGRGNGSWWDIPYDKKGYKIKFDKKQSLFGREANKHWVIIACVSSPYPETTMCRNYLAYNMANDVFDGIEYTTSANWIDVYVNGEYRGVYLLCEHVRVGDGRVDIPSDYLTSDYDNTGYLIEYDNYAREGGTEEGVDYFTVNGMRFPFTVHSPDPEDVHDGKATVTKAEYMQQIAWLKGETQKLCNAALASDWTGFCEYADADSFIDMYILHELFKNMDTGYSSFYLYKKPNGKFYAGPAWDFDATCMASDASPTGIFVAAEGRAVPASEFYVNLYKNAAFKQAVKTRWKEISSSVRTFLDERLNDTVYETYKAAMGKNYAKWLNRTQAEAEEKWVADVKALKTWLVARVNWLDTEWK